MTSRRVKSQLINGVIGSSGLRVIGMALSFLVGVQLARSLGVEAYGIYGVGMSVVALLSVPVELGMPQLLIREVAAAEVSGNWGLMNGVLHWARQSSWIFSGVVGLGIFGWICVVDRNLLAPLSLVMMVGALMIPLSAQGQQRAAALMGLHRVVLGQIPEVVIRPAIFSLLLFMALRFTPSSLTPVGAMMLGTVSAGVAYVVGIVLLSRALPLAAQSVKREIHASRWWASAIPMAMTEGMRQLQGNVAILVMGLLATAASVGAFRAASSIAAIASIPITLFILVGSPMISRLYTQGDVKRLQRLLGWISAGMTGGAIILTLPFLIAGDSLLNRLFGEGFEASEQPLMILCLGSILYSAIGSSVNLLNMTRHERRVTRAFFISVGALLLLAIPLIKYFGANGAAWANVIAMLLGNVLMWRDVRRLLALDASIFSLLRS